MLFKNEGPQLQRPCLVFVYGQELLGERVQDLLSGLNLTFESDHVLNALGWIEVGPLELLVSVDLLSHVVQALYGALAKAELG